MRLRALLPVLSTCHTAESLGKVIDRLIAGPQFCGGLDYFQNCTQFLLVFVVQFCVLLIFRLETKLLLKFRKDLERVFWSWEETMQSLVCNSFGCHIRMSFCLGFYLQVSVVTEKVFG